MMVEMMKPYGYQALEGHGSVRLIELQPSASTTDIVQCKLVQKTLKQIQEDIVTPYTALSYAWGNPNDTTSILVDKSGLQITKSLDCALRHSRDTERIMYIWQMESASTNTTTSKRHSKSCSWARSIRSHIIQSSVLDQAILLLETFYAEFKNVSTMTIIHVSSLMWLWRVD
jgi:hypothetical protein